MIKKHSKVKPPIQKIKNRFRSGQEQYNSQIAIRQAAAGPIFFSRLKKLRESGHMLSGTQKTAEKATGGPLAEGRSRVQPYFPALYAPSYPTHKFHESRSQKQRSSWSQDCISAYDPPGANWLPPLSVCDSWGVPRIVEMALPLMGNNRTKLTEL